MSGRVLLQHLLKTVKGVKTRVIETTITFDNFLQCLREKLIQYREQRVIRSHLHKVYTEKQTNILSR